MCSLLRSTTLWSTRVEQLATMELEHGDASKEGWSGWRQGDLELLVLGSWKAGREHNVFGGRQWWEGLMHVREDRRTTHARRKCHFILVEIVVDSQPLI